MRAVGDRGAAGTPKPRQGKAAVGVDQIGSCGLQLGRIDMLDIDAAKSFGGGDVRRVTRGLSGTEVAAIAEDRENIALFRVGKLGIRAGWWPKMTGVAGPACAVFENIEQMPFTHAAVDFRFEGIQSFRLSFAERLFEMGLPGIVDRQFGIVWKAVVNPGCRLGELSLQPGDERHTFLRYAGGTAIVRQTRQAIRPGQELGTIVVEVFGAQDIEIARLQGIRQVDEDADLERSSIGKTATGAAFDNKALPALGRPETVVIMDSQNASMWTGGWVMLP